MLEALIKEARGWLRDCGMSSRGDDDTTAVLMVSRAYEGGWPAFVAADPDADTAAVYAAALKKWGGDITALLYPAADPTPTGDPGKLYL